MAFALPDLPYPREALEPHLSAETLSYHHGRHHAAYVDNLNGLIVGTEFADMPLEEIVAKAPAGGIFNNAAQVWNHTFYFRGLSPAGGGEPDGELAGAIATEFGSFAAFREEFTRAAAGNFGSGWTWLARAAGGGLEIVNTSNAGTLAVGDQRPLLTIDVWEHAYYLDVRNERPRYIERWWQVVDWSFVAGNFAG